MKISTLRPGLLVSLNTSISGNVKYFREDIVPDHLTKDGTKEASWTTERTIADPKEHEAAIKARTKARIAITRVCSASKFGLLCPEEKRDQLDAAIVEARKIAEDFNVGATLTHVGVYAIVGRVAADDVEAVRAINKEVRDLLSVMENGLKNLSVKTVREAANKAKGLEKVLSPEAADRIKIAIDAARSSARRIVKAGENVTVEIDRQTITKIARQRTAFLDLDDAVEVSVPKVRARAVDLECVK